MARSDSTEPSFFDQRSRPFGIVLDVGECSAPQAESPQVFRCNTHRHRPSVLEACSPSTAAVYSCLGRASRVNAEAWRSFGRRKPAKMHSVSRPPSSSVPLRSTRERSIQLPISKTASKNRTQPERIGIWERVANACIRHLTAPGQIGADLGCFCTACRRTERTGCWPPTLFLRRRRRSQRLSHRHPTLFML